MNSSHAKIGYARTSTSDQNLDAQITALKSAGCGMVRTEQKSGTTLDGRSELKTILEWLFSALLSRKRCRPPSNLLICMVSDNFT